MENVKNNNFYKIKKIIFFKKIGAINMTKQEDWHIYRSNKSEFSEYLTTTGDNYMKLNETHKQRAKDLLKKQKAREIEKIQQG